MKVAFCRFSQNTDLDYSIASVASRNTEERLGILEALVECGHEVTIVSFVSPKHRHVFDGESKSELYDNLWMSALKWKMYPDFDDYDVLIVETATSNTMFSFTHDGKKMSYVGYFAELLRKAQGIPIVIYHHGNRGISFPFSRLSCAVEDTWEDIKDLSDNNFRKLFYGIDIWNGYEWVLWTKAFSTELFLDAFATYYNRPEINISRFISTPIGYSERYDLRLPVQDPTDSEFDLVYVGSAKQEQRIPKIKRFYDTNLYSSLLVGEKWSDLHWNHPESLDMPGRSKFHGDVHTHYRRGVACVQILNDTMAMCGLATTRHIQAIRAGSLCMVESGIVGADEWVGNEFIVDSAEDVMVLLEKYTLDMDMMEEINDYQNRLLYRWDYIIPSVLDVAIGKNKGDYR